MTSPSLRARARAPRHASFLPARALKHAAAVALSLLLCCAPAAPALAQKDRGAKPAGRPVTARTAGGAKSEQGATEAAGRGVRLAAPRLPAAPQATTLTATKTDNIALSSSVAPGANITYTVTITNNGAEAATNVQLADTIDPNTTLASAILASPLANDDAYNVVGNVRIQPTAAQGVLSNDAANEATISGFGATLAAANGTSPGNSVTTADGGTATLNSNGSFSYNPAPGFTGTDEIFYTLTNPSNSSLANTAQVTFTVAGMVFFVNDDDPVAGGDGRLTNPFNCLVGPGCFSDSTADEAGDSIFLFEGAYTGGLTLLNAQKLIGQGATDTLATLAGVTPAAYSDPLPQTNEPATNNLTPPTITAAAANGVNLGQNNTLRGFNVGSVGNANRKINGTGFGQLTVGKTTEPDVSLSGTGMALFLQNGTFAATSGLGSVATTGSSAQGLLLTQITAGALTIAGTAVAGATSGGIEVNGSSANLNFGNTTVNTGGTDGVVLANNPAGTRTFGTLSITGGSGIGFRHFDPDGVGAGVGGGAVSVTGATTITNPAGVGIRVDSSNANLSFAATTVNKGSTSNIGVDLTNNATRTISFASLIVTTTNAFALNANNSGTVNAGGGSLTQNGAGGGAASLTSTALGLNFTSVSSTSGGNGVIISGGSGTFTTGTTILQTIAGAAILMSSSGVAANFGNTTVNGSAGAGVSLSNNTAAITFADLDIAPNANNIALSATTNTGTISATSGTISATDAAALSVSGSPLSMTLTSVSADNTGDPDSCVSLTTTSGTLNMQGGTLTGGTGAAFNVSGGNATVTYSGSITQNSAARIVNVDGTTGGSVTFNTGTVTNTGSSTGVNINNANGGVSFVGLTHGTSVARLATQAVTISGGTGAKILGVVSIFTTGASGVGIGATNSTGAISSTSGTVDAAGAAAVSISGTSSASRTPLNMQLTTVNANGGANGLLLQNTSATGSPGGFRVLGTTSGICGGSVTNTTNPAVAATVTAAVTADCTGGSIQSMTANGIRLNFVERISFTRIRVENGAQNGIFGTEVNGFELISSYLSNNGNNVDEGGLKFTDVTNPGTNNGLVGTAIGSPNQTRIINSTVRQSGEFNVEIVNRSGTLTDLLVDGSQFTDTKLNAGPADADGFNAELQGTSVGTIRFTNSFFSGNLTQGAQVSAIDTANLTTSVKSSTFTNNNEGFICNHSSGGSDLNCTVGGDVATEGNHFRGQPTEPVIGSGALIVASTGSTATAAASQTTKIKFNNVATPANQVNHAVIAFMSGVGTPGSVNISNNTVNNVTFGHAIFVDTPDNPSTPQFSVTANNNAVTNNAPGGHGVIVQARQASTACVLIQNNTGTVAAGSSVARVRAVGTTTPTVQNATLNLKQGVSASVVAATVIQDNNPGVPTSVNPGTNGTINVVANNACTTPAQGPVTFDGTMNDTGGGLGEISKGTAASSENGVIDTPIALPAASASLPQPEPQPAARTGGGVWSDIEQTGPRARAAFAGNGGPLKIDAHNFAQLRRARIVNAAYAPSNRTTARAAEVERPSAPAPPPPAQAKAGGSAPSFASFPVSLGTIPAGESVTVVFTVTVNDPLPQGTLQVSNQGTVTGTNFASPVSTDDPETAAAGDATATKITPPPDLFIRDAREREPVSGSSLMVFTVALSAASAQTVTAAYATAADSGGASPAASTDYAATSGTVSFAPGERVKTVTVQIPADADSPEADETFLVNLSAPTNANISDAQATGTITQANPAGTALISELRTSGPGAGGAGDANDDYVEIYNNSDAPLTVAATDASAGWALVASNNGCLGDPVIVGTIPNGTIIPARGHYLFVGTGYSLAAYAAGDQTLAANLNADAKLGLFSTAALVNLSSVNRLDAVGSGVNAGGLCELLNEGTDVAGANASTSQYAFVRNQTTGRPLDRNDNATDFLVVSATPATPVGDTADPRLGAPGPENLASPINRSSSIKALLVDPMVASSSPQNRVRNLTPDAVNNSTAGTLAIRRRFTNTTGGSVSRLRFRVIDITTCTIPPCTPGASAPAGVADLRVRTSSTSTISLTGGGTAQVQGLTLETPPAQPSGGGWNSTVAAGTITAGTPLAAGASINVEFLLGVQQTGTFRFFVIVEALPGGPPFAPDKLAPDRGVGREEGKELPRN